MTSSGYAAIDLTRRSVAGGAAFWHSTGNTHLQTFSLFEEGTYLKRARLTVGCRPFDSGSFFQGRTAVVLYHDVLF